MDDITQKSTYTNDSYLKKKIIKFFYELDVFSIDKHELINKFMNKFPNSEIYTDYEFIQTTVESLIEEKCINHMLRGPISNFQPSNLIKLHEEKCLSNSYLNISDISKKMASFNSKYMNLIKSINEENCKLKGTIHIVQNDIAQLKDLKVKIIEIMSIFIAAFALIIGNIDILNNTKFSDSIDVISSLFLGNGIIITSILTLILGINIIILKDKSEKKTYKKEKLFIFLLPIILFIFGILIRHYPKILNM